MMAMRMTIARTMNQVMKNLSLTPMIMMTMMMMMTSDGENAGVEALQP